MFERMRSGYCYAVLDKYDKDLLYFLKKYIAYDEVQELSGKYRVEGWYIGNHFLHDFGRDHFPKISNQMNLNLVYEIGEDLEEPTALYLREFKISGDVVNTSNCILEYTAANITKYTLDSVIYDHTTPKDLLLYLKRYYNMFELNVVNDAEFMYTKEILDKCISKTLEQMILNEDETLVSYISNHPIEKTYEWEELGIDKFAKYMLDLSIALQKDK